MDETKVQIGEDVLLDIGIHSDWYISAVSYNGESVSVDLRRKADRYKEWWLAEVHKMIDNSDIAEDAYPDLRQRMHKAVERLDEYYPSEDKRSK